MKKTKNCGFTLIELVIVIAVIAILSAVLIPTFGNLISDAQNSARDQKAKNAYSDFITFHPTEDNSYLFIEIKDGGKTYYYSVLEGQIDLDHETENLSVDVEKIKPIECTGYTVYPTSANALWQERWDDIIKGNKEITEVLIVSYNGFSSITAPGGLESRSLEADEVSNFTNYIKSRNFEFNEVSSDHEEYYGVTIVGYQVIMINEAPSDSDEDKQYYYTHFAVNKNGYLFAITGTLDKSSPYDLASIAYRNGSRVLMSTEAIDEPSVIEEYFTNYAD